jgi:hypothetical protein
VRQGAGKAESHTEEKDVKKFLTIAALALGLGAASAQQASAWVKCNFAIGLTWHWESGNNNFLWGFFRNGQVPGYPTDFYGNAPGSLPAVSPYAGLIGGPVYYGDFGGHAPNGGPGFVAPPPSQTAEPPAAKGASAAPSAQPSAGYYGTSGYQPVGYYQAPSYGTPSYGYYGGQGYYGYGSYGNHQVPSYWYGY